MLWCCCTVCVCCVVVCVVVCVVSLVLLCGRCDKIMVLLGVVVLVELSTMLSMSCGWFGGYWLGCG